MGMGYKKSQQTSYLYWMFTVMALTCIQVVGFVFHSHASLSFPHSWVSWPLLGTDHCRRGCICHCNRTWASRYHIRWWSEDNKAGSECNTANSAPSCMFEEDMQCKSLDGEGQPEDEVIYTWRRNGRKVCVVTVCVHVLHVLSVYMYMYMYILACGLVQGMVVFSS